MSKKNRRDDEGDISNAWTHSPDLLVLCKSRVEVKFNAVKSCTLLWFQASDAPALPNEHNTRPRDEFYAVKTLRWNLHSARESIRTANPSTAILEKPPLPNQAAFLPWPNPPSRHSRGAKINAPDGERPAVPEARNQLPRPPRLGFAPRRRAPCHGAAVWSLSAEQWKGRCGGRGGGSYLKDSAGYRTMKEPICPPPWDGLSWPVKMIHRNWSSNLL